MVSDEVKFGNVYIWDQSDTAYQAVWEWKAEYWKTELIKIWVFKPQLKTLFLLQIDVVDKLYKLDQWNLCTKNVKHKNPRRKWFEITDQACLEM